MYKNINLLVCSILILYPIFLLVFAVHHVIGNGIGLFEIILLLMGYYVSNITVGVGLHRLWSHSSYKTNKYVEFILALLAAGTLQGPILSWASNHFKHHSYTDTALDPHTPLKYRNRVLGFLWAHIGWMLVGEGSYKSIDRVTMAKLGKNAILRWQLKNYAILAVLMNTVVPFAVGYLFGGMTMQAGYMGFLFIGVGRAVQQEITFFVNSLCHYAGTKKYVNGTAGDVWWLAPLLLGENWHNFHHAFPADYRNGHKWYQFDVHKWIIYLMYRLGLAWDLNKTSEVRVNAKISQVQNNVEQDRRDVIVQLDSKIDVLFGVMNKHLQKFNTARNSAKDAVMDVLDSQVNIKINEVLTSLNDLKSELKLQMHELSISSDALMNRVANKIAYLESMAKQVNSDLDVLCAKYINKVTC